MAGVAAAAVASERERERDKKKNCNIGDVRKAHLPSTARAKATAVSCRPSQG